MIETLVYWQHSKNQELIEAVNKYWRGERELSDRQITVLSCYLQMWIDFNDYPDKEKHLAQAEEIERIEDIKYLTNQIMNWGIDPW